VNTPTFDVIICGLDELALHRRAGVTHVLSIIDPDWPEPTELDLWAARDRLLVRFHDVIDADPFGRYEPPGERHVAQILEFGRGLPRGQAVRLLTHCHAGVSRSTASALLLLAQREPARGADAILAQIAGHRPQAWPNLRIVEIGDALMGRGGALVQATRRFYRAVVADRPDLAEMMRAGGRGREIDG
jgi:predicted protein tyrosine phosphatase